MQSFKGRRVARTYTWEIPSAPDKVFPLLCPVRETEWIPGWSCEMIYSESGVAEKGCIFKTSFPGDGEELWVISRHEPDSGHFEAVRFIEGSKLVTVEVSLASADGRSTTLTWVQTATGLDNSGNEYLEAFPEQASQTHMDALGKLLAHYCETGKMLGA
jgi:hypothetical protein